MTTTDLLKNHLFSRVRVGSDLKSLQRRWQSLLGTVGQTHFPKFLRYHMLCEHSKIRSQRLFKLVRERTQTAQEVFSLLDELENRGELFAAVLDPNHGYWLDLPEARPYVGELHLFGIRQPMPLLFTTWETFSRQDFVRVLKLISAVSFRYSVVSGLNPNALEIVYHRAAKAVAEGEAATPAAVFARLEPIYVDDEKMQQDFALLEIDAKRRRKLAKYILTRLEGDASGRRCDPDTDPGSIEHVLPENPADVWDETYPRQQWENGVYRLGNLTLLEAAANREIANELYPDKLDAYARSTYEITRQIPKMAPEQWTPELVDARQRQLAKRAAQAWRADFA